MSQLFSLAHKLLKFMFMLMVVLASQVMTELLRPSTQQPELPLNLTLIKLSK